MEEIQASKSSNITRLGLIVTILMILIEESICWCHDRTLSVGSNVDVNSIDFHPLGGYMVTADDGADVKIWDTSSWSVIANYSWNSKLPLTAKFSKTGNRLGIGYQADNQIHILNVSNWQKHFQFSAGHGTTKQIDWNQNDSRFLACGTDNKISIWTTGANSFTTSYNITETDDVNSCKFDKFSRVAMASDTNRVKVYHANHQTNTFVDQDQGSDVLCVALREDGSFVISGNSNTKGYASQISINNINEICDANDDLQSCAYSRQSDYFAFGSKDNDVYVFNATSNNNGFLETLTESSSDIKSLAFSYDGFYLAAGNQNGEIDIYKQVCIQSCTVGYYYDLVSLTCTTCSVMDGCGTCTSDTLCLSCIQGYYLRTPNNDCVLCTSAPNCAVCNASNYCILCLPGYYNNSGACPTCHSAITGCLTCNSSTVCIQCHNDYYLHTDKKCYLCSRGPVAQTNCLKCNASNYCLSCNMGYFSNSGSCQACSANCLVCQSATNCKECTIGFYQNSNVCTTCGPLCLSCTSGPTTCVDCIQGYFSSTGTCTRCVFPCQTCNDTNYCFTCAIGFYDAGSGVCLRCHQTCASCSALAANNCISCPIGTFLTGTNTCSNCENITPYCSKCTNSLCINCIIGFFYDSGSSLCKSCATQMYSCLACSSSTNCLECGPGTYHSGTANAANSSCLLCAQGCTSCTGSANTNCLSCASGFYLAAGNTCTRCGGTSAHCSTCNTATNCLSCDIGYFLQTGTPNLCRECSVNITGCLDCYNQSYCISCRNGYFLKNSDKLCYTCTAPCVTCETTTATCLTCELGYYFQSSGSPSYCIICPQNCSTCETSSNCTSCISGFYHSTASGTGTCIRCSLHGCLTCDSATNCLSCRAGTYLNSSNQECTSCISQISNCLDCSAQNLCLYCSYGYILSATADSCESCSVISGCSHCSSTTDCQVCQPGFYLRSADKECILCLPGCSTCSGPLITNCLTCEPGFLYDTSSGSSKCSLCQDLLQGCLLCTSATICVECLNGYYLDTVSGSPTENECLLCRSALKGCSYCNDSSICIHCQDGYYLDLPSNNLCQPCSDIDGCQLCNSSSICLDCQTGYYLNTPSNNLCNLCSNIPGCLSCANISHCYDCKSGYYLDVGNTQTCLLCQSILPGCVLCQSSAICKQCQGGFYLNAGNNQCSRCSQNGCEICQETNPANCVTCNSRYYLSGPIGNSQCLPCSTLQGCIQCSIATQCQFCDTGYFLDIASSPNLCKLCSGQSSLQGCMKCSSDGSQCFECKSAYFLDLSTNLCEACSEQMAGCGFCVVGTACLACNSGFYLNATTQFCQSCTRIQGCIMCQDQNTCIFCKSQYYLDSITNPTNPQCTLCSSVIEGCFACASQSLCTSCQGGYTLQNNACSILQLSAAQPVTGLRLKSYIVSATKLKHILYASNKKYEQVQENWTAQTVISIALKNGTTLSLTIESVQYGAAGNDLVFYTNNPLNYTSSSMPFLTRNSGKSRLLIEQLTPLEGINGFVNLDLSEKVLKDLLPDFPHTGNLAMSYNLQDPQFFSSFVQSTDWGLYYIYGLILTVIVLVYYFIQTTFLLPYSEDKGHLIPHIFALKTGVLTLYPTYIEYLSFCYGFMTADLPWLDRFFGAVLADSSQYVPAPYAVFYANMSLASMYLLAVIVIIVIILIAFIVFKSLGQNYNDRYSSFRQFNYNFFILGAVMASCASLQGAILNPIDQVSLNAVFYILGIVLYIIILMECFWSLYQSKTYIYKIRIVIKATMLSLMHFSPVYIAASALVVDTLFIFAQFCLLKDMKPYPKIWVINNLLPNIALTMLIYVPFASLAMIIAGALVLIALINDVVFHILEYCYPNQDSIQIFKETVISFKTKNQTWFSNLGKDQKRKKVNKSETQQNVFYQSNANIWDIGLQNEKIDNEKGNDNLANKFSRRNYDFDRTQQTIDAKNQSNAFDTRYHSNSSAAKRRRKQPKVDLETNYGKTNQMKVNSYRKGEMDDISQDSDIFAPGDVLKK